MEQAAPRDRPGSGTARPPRRGIFTHFSDADGSEEYTMLQFDRFLDILQRVQALGHTLLSATAPIAQPPYFIATYLNMVRPALPFTGIS